MDQVRDPTNDPGGSRTNEVLVVKCLFNFLSEFFHRSSVVPIDSDRVSHRCLLSANPFYVFFQLKASPHNILCFYVFESHHRRSSFKSQLAQHKIPTHLQLFFIIAASAKQIKYRPS